MPGSPPVHHPSDTRLPRGAATPIWFQAWCEVIATKEQQGKIEVARNYLRIQPAFDFKAVKQHLAKRIEALKVQ